MVDYKNVLNTIIAEHLTAGLCTNACSCQMASISPQVIWAFRPSRLTQDVKIRVTGEYT